MTTHGWYSCANCGRPVAAQDDSGRRDLCPRCGGPAAERLAPQARTATDPSPSPDSSLEGPAQPRPQPGRKRR